MTIILGEWIICSYADAARLRFLCPVNDPRAVFLSGHGRGHGNRSKACEADVAAFRDVEGAQTRQTMRREVKGLQEKQSIP